jgi:pyruvate/2-oxoglutarate/acetoin dehydrogenase E1 component
MDSSARASSGISFEKDDDASANVAKKRTTSAFETETICARAKKWGNIVTFQKEK